MLVLLSLFVTNNAGSHLLRQGFPAGVPWHFSVP